MTTHTGEYRFHDDDCLCKFVAVEYCNRNGSIWSCCRETTEDGPCGGREPATTEPANVGPAMGAMPPPSPSRAQTPATVFRWLRKIGGRIRRFRFEMRRNEVLIPSHAVTRDDVEPDFPEQAEFLDKQADLLHRTGGHSSGFDESADSRRELVQRLDRSQD